MSDDTKPLCEYATVRGKRNADGSFELSAQGVYATVKTAGEVHSFLSAIPARSPFAVDDLSKVFANPSGASRFMGCEMTWALHTLLGVDKRRGPSSDARDRGKAMHAFVDHYVRRYAETGKLDALAGRDGLAVAREVFARLDEDEGVAFGEQETRDILEAARAQLPKLGLDRFDVVRLNEAPGVELNLRTVIGVLDFEAIVDCVLRHKTTGEVWVVDWKTTLDQLDTVKTNNFVELDVQLAIQRIVVRAQGLAVDRSALVQIRSAAPEQPPITSRGVTRNLKKVSCDAKTYRQAIVDNGEALDVKTLAKVSELERNVFVRWLPDITSPAADDALTHELYEMREAMRQIASGERLPRMSIRNFAGQSKYLSGCARCDYHKWCRAALTNGGRPDFSLVGIEYVRNDKATFDKVPSRVAPEPAAAYVEWSKAYGHDVSKLGVFEP